MAKNTTCVNANTAWPMNWLANDSIAELVGYVVAAQGVDKKTALARLAAIIHSDEKGRGRIIRSLQSHRHHSNIPDFLDDGEEDSDWN
jgi:hypothetical protein